MKQQRIATALLLSILLMMPSALSAQQGYIPSESNLEARRAVKQARLGIFVHWGLYSMLGDGFSMWRSSANPYNVYDATPFHRDVVGELAAACRMQDFRLFEQEWGTLTRKGNTIFVHILKPVDTVTLPYKARKVTAFDGTPLKFSSLPDGISFAVPSRPEGTADQIVKIELKP